MAFAGDWLPPVNPGEIRSLSITFAPYLSSGDLIQSVTSVAISVYIGTDPNVSALLINNAIIDSTNMIVSQMVGPHYIPDTIYRVTVTVLTLAGETLILYGHLACAAVT